MNKPLITVALSTLTFESVLSSTASSHRCGNAFSCVGELLNATSDIHIDGYRAARDATATVYNNRSKALNSQSTNDLECSAAYSCNKIVRATVYDDDIKCNGHESCSNAEKPLFATDSLTCSGANSCNNLTLQAANTIQCYGSQSCTNSLITNDYNISILDEYYNDLIKLFVQL